MTVPTARQARARRSLPPPNPSAAPRSSRAGWRRREALKPRALSFRYPVCTHQPCYNISFLGDHSVKFQRPALAVRALAGCAESADLDHLAVDPEAERPAVPLYRRDDGVIMQFLRRAAIAADDELALMRMAGIETGDEGIERFDAVDEFLLEEKIDGAIDRRRHRMATQPPQQPIGADRLTRFENELEDAAPGFRQTDAALATDPFGHRERLLRLSIAHG